MEQQTSALIFVHNAPHINDMNLHYIDMNKCTLPLTKHTKKRKSSSVSLITHLLNTTEMKWLILAIIWEHPLPCKKHPIPYWPLLTPIDSQFLFRFWVSLISNKIRNYQDKFRKVLQKKKKKDKAFTAPSPILSALALKLLSSFHKKIIRTLDFFTEILKSLSWPLC